jgi:hypothetical protein
VDFDAVAIFTLYLSPLASVFPLFSDEYDDDEPAPTKNTYYTLL